METVQAEANRLRTWRREKGLSLADVASLTGVTPSMLSRVERGERRLAPLTRVAVARRLGVSVAALFDVDATDAA